MLISRIRKSIELPAGDQRIAARMTLGFVAAILCLALVLAGASMGLAGAVSAQPSPSGSPSPSGTGGAEGRIVLLNPSKAYEPVTEVQEPVTPDPSVPDDPGAVLDFPKISDKFDGTDEAYHVVAVVKDPPSTALVEAYYQSGSSSEVTVGQLSPVPGSPDTYEFFWNVPANLNPGFGTFTVRLYEETPSGFEQVGEDAVEVRLQHEFTLPEDEPPGISASETVEFAWPSQNGPLGFFKSGIAGGVWRTVVEGTTSHSTDADPQTGEPGSTGADQVRVFYTTTAIGSPPVFKLCGTDNTGGGGPNGAEEFAVMCTLQGVDRPTQVKALAAVALQDHDPSGPNNGFNPRYSQEAADVHRVQPYLQRVEDMDIEVRTEVTAQALARRHSTPGGRCIAYKVTVKDLLDRPVQGANVDVHVRGPVDQMFFGTDTRNSATSSGKQRPQDNHSGEGSVNCQTPANLSGEHGDHNVPGASDVKHIESNSGTGVSGGATVTFGQWLFLLFTRDVGDTDITVWIDEEPVPDDQTKRELDDDVLEDTEASDTNFAQWLSAAPALTIDPQGATAATGECQRFVVRARGGTRAVRGANIDVHAVGPTNELDFCDPADASPRSAPDAGTGHNAEDEGEMTHAGQPPVAQHTEGQTNEQGNFVIGITSPDPGDTTLTAWYDSGEPGSDDDEPGEASATATTNWIQSTGDAAISFLNPSGYGSAGTNVAKTRDVDDAYHVVVRVSSVQPVPGVELLYRSGTAPLVKIADAARVGQTDTWEAYWPVDVADGSYTLVARIRDTNVTAEQAVTVQNED
ncbi:MAG TPA: hypothetical protein VHJ76_02420, partial [Actinomycetota bacterium]|nr:hypothetical protein [Actinomycetota bacterium]